VNFGLWNFGWLDFDWISSLNPQSIEFSEESCTSAKVFLSFCLIQVELGSLVLRSCRKLQESQRDSGELVGRRAIL
jgi:hypothetical protein